jgi:hypothetical protein
VIVEATRLIDRWLRHPQQCVGAMLQTVPRMTPEGEEDPEPENPLIYNDTEHEEVAANLDPPTSPALVLFADGELETDAHQRPRQVSTELIVAIAYVTRDMPPVAAARDGGYVLRAVRKSLNRYNDERLSFDFRELNGVKIAAVRRVEQQRVAGAVGQSQLWGFVIASLTVIDSSL